MIEEREAKLCFLLCEEDHPGYLATHRALEKAAFDIFTFDDTQKLYSSCFAREADVVVVFPDMEGKWGDGYLECVSKAVYPARVVAVAEFGHVTEERPAKQAFMEKDVDAFVRLCLPRRVYKEKLLRVIDSLLGTCGGQTVSMRRLQQRRRPSARAVLSAQ